MRGSWGTFRAETGDVSVSPDAIRIHRSPRRYLQGVGLRWRHGDRWQRAWMVMFLLFVIGLLSIWPLAMWDETIDMVSRRAIGGLLLSYSWLLQMTVRFGLQSRDVTIPLSAVTDVTLDAEERELTITHDESRRLDFSTWGAGTTEESLTLPTDDDVRDARTVLRTVDIVEEIEPSESGETETAYRVDERSGVLFCERCGSQVSPTHATCPACDYALQVERAVEADSRRSDRRDRNTSDAVPDAGTELNR
ncbi:MAG: hypothetical protein ABEH88_01365 [Halobacteriales archaeon]